MKWWIKIGYIFLGIIAVWTIALGVAIMFTITKFLIEEAPTIWKELYG